MRIKSAYQSTIFEISSTLTIYAMCAMMLSFSACQDSESKKPNPEMDERLSTTLLMETTKIEFVETVYDFGDVQEGEKVEHTFKFKNTGEKALLIANSFGSCGCTVPEYPKEVISPGESNEIKVIFNSKGRGGKQIKKVFIVANTEPNRTELVFTANVLENQITQ